MIKVSDSIRRYQLQLIMKNNFAVSKAQKPEECLFSLLCVLYYSRVVTGSLSYSKICMKRPLSSHYA